MERLRPLVRADDASAIFVVLEGPCRDRIAPVPAFLLADIKPFLESLIDRPDFVGERPFFGGQRDLAKARASFSVSNVLYA